MGYWEKRFEQLKNRQMSKAEASNADLKATYASALKKLLADVNYWYVRYAKENNMSLADAKKELNARELKAFKIDLQEYTKLAKDEKLSDEYRKLLNQASVRARLDRSQEIIIKVTNYIEQLSKKQQDSLKAVLQDVYQDSYYQTAYETQQVKGYNPLNEISQATIDTAISRPWAEDGKAFSDRIWDNKTKLINSLQREITYSLIAQEGVANMSKRIEKRFNVSFAQAHRLAETETAYVQELATMNSYQDIGVEQYKVLAVLDTKTSETCRHLDGKVFDCKDAKAGLTMPPFHCYCRTTTTPYFEGIDDEDDKRVARGKDGKKEQVPGALNYKEWYNQYVEHVEDKGLRLGAKELDVGDAEGVTTLESIKKIDFNNPQALKIEIEAFCKEYAFSDVEHNLEITTNGYAYKLKGNKISVDPSMLGEERLKGSIGIHNHPVQEGEVMYDSFSISDLKFAAHYQQGKQYLISGTRRNAFELTGKFTRNEINVLWNKAKYMVWEEAYIRNSEVVNEQESIMKMLSKTVRGIVFYENF